MKKTNLLFVLFLLLQLPSLLAQDWFPENATWVNNIYSWGHRGSETIIVSSHDTILGGQTCKMLNNITQWETSSSPNVGEDYYLYEQDGQVFQWHDDEFRLIYDFTMQVGDSLEVYLSAAANFDCEHPAYFVVDSINMLSLDGVDRMVQYGTVYDFFEEQTFYVTMIETIGMISKITEDGNYNFGGHLIPRLVFPCFFDGPSFYFCSYQDVLTDFNPSGEVCEIEPLSIKEFLNIPIEISPNPCGHFLNLSYPDGLLPDDIQIRTATGQLLHHFTHPSHHLVLNNDYQGLLFLTLTFHEEVVTKKILKLNE